MSYVGQWSALSNRIKSMITAGTAALERRDALGSVALIRGQSRQVFNAIKEFRASFGPSLSTSAAACIENFIKDSAPVVTGDEGSLTPEMHREYVSSILTRFEVFEGEMTYHLSDTQAVIQARSELAFVHLQRQIVVDSDIQKKWQKAFSEREERSEALGAVHLLSHGIWAFKAQAEGGRTDLVLQEPIDLEKAQRVAQGLVLTEWKKAGSPEEAQKKFAEARDQARRYVGGIGVFASNELRGYRYAVVVTEKDVPVPNNYEDPKDKIIYRHINIAVEPRTPSKAKS
jgi:hypothetical protein